MLFAGKEIASDSYDHKELVNGAIISMETKVGDFVCIVLNPLHTCEKVRGFIALLWAQNCGRVENHGGW
jgi:hypothetical protein